MVHFLSVRSRAVRWSERTFSCETNIGQHINRPSAGPLNGVCVCKTDRLSTSPLRALISIRISSSSIPVAGDGVVPGRRCIADGSGYVLVVR